MTEDEKQAADVHTQPVTGTAAEPVRVVEAGEQAHAARIVEGDTAIEVEGIVVSDETVAADTSDDANVSQAAAQDDEQDGQPDVLTGEADLDATAEEEAFDADDAIAADAEADDTVADDAEAAMIAEGEGDAELVLRATEASAEAEEGVAEATAETVEAEVEVESETGEIEVGASAEPGPATESDAAGADEAAEVLAEGGEVATGLDAQENSDDDGSDDEVVADAASDESEEELLRDAADEFADESEEVAAGDAEAAAGDDPEGDETGEAEEAAGGGRSAEVVHLVSAERAVESDPEADSDDSDDSNERPDELRQIEALLFAAGEPLDEKALSKRLPEGVDVRAALRRLQTEYAPRGVNLVHVGSRWAFRTANDLAWLLTHESVQPRKLSRAAMETLAIIAYHQPVTRAEVEEIRGVSAAKGSIDVLLETGWIKPRGRRKAPGRPLTFGTTEDFLSQFGIESLGDLPGLEELKGAGMFDGALPAGFSVPMPSDDPALREDEDPLEPGDLDLGLAPRIAEGGE